MIRKYSIVCAFLLVGFAASAQVKDKVFRVSSALQSKMVIQQERPFTIWGRAEPGRVIYVKTDWSSRLTKTICGKDSTWVTQVNVNAAHPGDFANHKIAVGDGIKNIILDSILIGDVWLCAGQSNMDMSMLPFPPWHKGVNNSHEEIAAANYPNIRLFRVTKETSEVVRDTLNGTWEICSPSSVAGFSGVGYYFGKKLYKELNIPIGLVESAFGGASCQAFIKKEVLASDSLLRRNYLDPYYANPKDKIPVLRPMLIYNAMIHPLINLSIKGFIWYQGESNAGEIKLYPRLNEAMIESWRKEFGNNDLPFYFVQMTPYSWGGHDSTRDQYAKFREAQQEILKLKNTGMVCTMDVGEPDNIHPTNKKPVGERLAALALYRDYDKRGFVYSGPMFKKIEVKKDKAEIYFRFTTKNEKLDTRDGSAPNYFIIAGKNKVFYPAEATIIGNKVSVSSPLVKNPVSVRYAFTDYPVTNLQNTAGFPVFPFRTDRWEK